MMKKKRAAVLIAATVLLCAGCLQQARTFQEAYVGGFCQAFDPHGTPSVGQVAIPVFMVEFKDTTYRTDRMSAEEIQRVVFDEGRENSMTSFEKNASYGRLSLDGEVFDYQTRHPMAYYKNEEHSFEELAEEVLTAFDPVIDYAKYDANGDGYVDAFVLSIAGEDDYWYGCQVTWWIDTGFTVDGMRLENYIINDAQPYQGEEDYFVAELCHEFGHCMGLPDYYKYDLQTDYDAMNGVAGCEMMDDMTGDYSMFSKLALGWLQRKNVKIYTGGKRTYRLHSAQREGNCIILPLDTEETDEKGIFTGEYFLIEYNTAEGNMASALGENEEGVRILHVDAEVYENENGSEEFRYNGYSPYYDTTHQGRRILRLVNDDGGYFTDGAVIDSGTPGFFWYDEQGKECVPTGFTIKIEAGADHTMNCTIIPQ